ncbi:hypothetical protein PYCCODRAFT_176565 [Trametes coccinea BRFM310]|uniref:Uncharacterized protein n=1 Tax=Trametes coccinea (strain BRFM310) TaxID=1353009 RepID=A0A1Y2IVX9_TRAC3|nr:hypothetical protein PYCCODRAFT_176565 [Trametes coccinea BRFM310]
MAAAAHAAALARLAQSGRVMSPISAAAHHPVAFVLQRRVPQECRPCGLPAAQHLSTAGKSIRGGHDGCWSGTRASPAVTEGPQRTLRAVSNGRRANVSKVAPVNLGGMGYSLFGHLCAVRRE